jgi:hypothetical protein
MCYTYISEKKLLLFPYTTYREVGRNSDSLRNGWSENRILGGGSEIFRTRPDQTWIPLSPLCNGCRVSSPGVKRPERGVELPSPSSA